MYKNMKCKLCRWRWISRVSDPVACPRCKRPGGVTKVQDDKGIRKKDNKTTGGSHKRG